MLVDLNTFQTLDFPKHRDIVYVLCYKRNDDNKIFPFYIGESSRHVGRLGDYVSANFSASTDFKVGEAVRYLQQLGCHVEVKFKDSSDRKSEEKALLQEFQKTYKLLNDLDGYNYKTANSDEERLRIRTYIDEIFTQNNQVTSKQITMGEEHTQVAQINLTIPERVKLICRELDALYDESIPSQERIIYRKDILKIAEERSINPSSVTVADYCDNGLTSRHSRHSFLHRINPGQYILKPKIFIRP